MSSKAIDYCKKRVFSGERWDIGGHQCSHKAFKNGLCKMHQPDVVQARKDKLTAKWKAESDARSWHYQRDALEANIIAAAKLFVSEQDDGTRLRQAVTLLTEHEANKP